MAVRNPSQRLKGQECTILITTNGVLEDTLTDIQDFDLEAEFEIKSMGYLGEKTNRKDEVYNGCKFKMKLNLHKQAWFGFQQLIKQRAQRLAPDTVFNITGVFAFPDGSTPTLLIPDCFFGAQPFNISARGDFVSVTLEGEANDFTVTQS